MTDRMLFDGLVTIVHGGKRLTASVKATANYYNEPGCLYLPNGDPGYPPEESFELENYEIVETENEDGEPFGLTPELEEEFAEAMMSDINLDNWTSERVDALEAEAEERWDI